MGAVFNLNPAYLELDSPNNDRHPNQRRLVGQHRKPNATWPRGRSGLNEANEDYRKFETRIWTVWRLRIVQEQEAARTEGLYTHMAKKIDHPSPTV